MATTLTTQEEISADRLNKQQMADALTLQSTTVRDSPIGASMAAVKLGVIVVVIGVVGALALHYLKPKPSLGDDKIVVDNESYSMYARDGEIFYPVLNLASARLVSRSHDKPEVVDHSIIAQQSFGPTIGIPNAPDELDIDHDKKAQWGVCDDEGEASFSGGLAPSSGQKMTDDQARYVSSHGESYVIWKGRKMRVNASNSGVLNALGITSGMQPYPVSDGFINSLQYYPDLIVPRVPHIGGKPQQHWRAYKSLRIGSVIQMESVSTGRNLYVILDHGIQPVSDVVGQMLLASSLTRQLKPVLVTAADVASAQKTIELDTSFYPENKLDFIASGDNPVTCYMWVKNEFEEPSSYLLYSHGLPFKTEEVNRSFEIISHSSGVAKRILFPGGVGFLVTTTGNDGTTKESSSVAFIDSRGVAYGIDTADHNEVLRYLGLMDEPLPIPSDMLKLLKTGPVLSRNAALVAHEGGK